MKDRCVQCGKKARMHCPALNNFLCSACCGSGRGRTIDCTIDCEVNPFGVAASGYQRFQDVDTKLIQKLFKMMADDGYDYHRMLRESARFKLIHEADDPIETGSFGVLQEWIFRKRENPLSKFEEWEASKWRGFTNDEKRIIESREHSNLTLIELQEVIGEFATVVKDLLDPDETEFVVFDYSLVRQFIPYKTLLIYVTRLENFARIEANAAIVPPENVEGVLQFLREKSGSADFGEQKDWLRKNAPVVAKVNAQLMEAARDRFMAGIDATAHVRVYQSDRSASAWAGYLDGHPEFDIEPDVDEGERNEAEYGPLKFLYVWLRRAGAEDAPRSGLARLRIDEDGSRLEVLAMVYVHQDFVRLESVGKILMGWTVDRWEAVIAPGLKVESSRVEDFEEREFSEREPVRNNSALLKNFEEGHYKDLIDHVVPALRDMSPRQASESADAEMGGILTRWAKSMIQNLAEKEARHGFVPHVFWFFEELGLEHLWPRDWPQGR